ncbi:RND family transporter [Halosolutus amylolyticus]|uniref:RND family transporter n=1 Tax=Halosolutus amylolyticus TaxID=2932267 RepID=A0ABD5PRN9_9EURY|nr:MMPL family transporter [Halosolutus amylolyticus]
MSGRIAGRYADAIVSHSRLVVVLVLLLTAVVGAGAAIGESEGGGIGQFDVDSEETRAQEEIDATYGTDERIVAQIVVRDEDGDVLTRESLLEGLRLQQEIREDDALNATLDEQGVVGIENVVATAAVFEDRQASATGPPDTTGQPDTSAPTLDEQITALESRSDAEVEALLADVLDPEGEQGPAGGSGGTGDPYEFLPQDYERGSTTADARITFVFQVDDSGPDEDPEAAYDAQVAIDRLVEDRFDDAFVFGQGITDEASANAVGDSFAIITPVALVLVLFALGVAYRDVVDVLLSLVGIAVVMAWLAGIMGWLEIPSSQLLIAVPFLLIGLSIDYSLHVIMRSREARAGLLDRDDTAAADGSSPGVRAGMRASVGGVVLALAAATFSTGIGFLSNVVSPLPAIRDFAILSAGGILATFVAFAVLVPALKVEVDDMLEGRFGLDRARQPFGAGAGVANRVLSGGVAVVQRAPIAIVLLALVLAVGGAYGATGIDTEFNQADFLPEDAPEWAKSLPGPLAPGTYTISDDAAYLGDNFRERGEGSRTEILIRGDVTDPATLATIEDATANVDGDGTLVVRSDGRAAIESPVTVLRALAAENESVAAALAERDTDGDGLPDEDLAGLYDVLYEADENAASSVLYRSGDGDDREYESARLLVSVRGDAAAQDAADDTRSVASAIEAESGGSITAVATGGPVTTAVIQDALLETLVQAFAVTLVVIFAFLTVLYWVRYRSLSLGAVTLAPVVAALAWLLGAMALLDLPFNSETAVITSLAIGLGVDYSIHVGERFIDERREAGRTAASRSEALERALAATVTGTGGALFGSALTTAAGFGVLALALAPPLQRFGLVTGLSIVFAFVSCLTVLPCLLVLRERLLAWSAT